MIDHNQDPKKVEVVNGDFDNIFEDRERQNTGRFDGDVELASDPVQF